MIEKDKVDQLVEKLEPTVRKAYIDDRDVDLSQMVDALLTVLVGFAPTNDSAKDLMLYTAEEALRTARCLERKPKSVR